jgi:hypothetical protein
VRAAAFVRKIQDQLGHRKRPRIAAPRDLARRREVRQALEQLRRPQCRTQLHAYVCVAGARRVVAVRRPGRNLDRLAGTEDAVAAVHPHRQRSRHDLVALRLQRMQVSLSREALRPAEDLVLEQLSA